MFPIELVKPAGGFWVVLEVYEPNLPRDEAAKWPRSSGLEFGPEQTGEGTQPSSNKTRADAVVKRVGEVALEVVSHFRFELDVRMNIEARAAANADEIYVGVGLTKAEIVRENTNLGVVVGRFRGLRRQKRGHSQTGK